MKTLKPGKLKRDLWIGRQVTCQWCEGHFLLEAEDKAPELVTPSCDPDYFSMPCPTPGCFYKIAFPVPS